MAYSVERRSATNTANVKNLQLQWVWAMNDSGANQTTPIVHNGIIYLATPSNIVQALDGGRDAASPTIPGRSPANSTS